MENFENYYYISGYFRDNVDNFDNYIVKDGYFHESQTLSDEDVFFYGLTEQEIKEEIVLGHNGNYEFIITSYGLKNNTRTARDRQ